jgi:hypothetical protein
MKIVEVIARENLFASEETAILKEEVRRYLDNSLADANEVLAARASGNISPAQLHSFLRQREREENTCQILQYLLMYADSLDAPSPTPDPEALRQMVGFVRFQVDILTRDDVRTAILCEYSGLGLVKPDLLWMHERRIDDMHRELSGILDRCAGGGGGNVRLLCLILQKLCLFWFDICREDFRRIRDSDLYTYKLALLVLHALEPCPHP